MEAPWRAMYWRGEVLRLRYGLGVAGVGAALSVFGLGLAVGNLLAGRASQCFAREESALMVGPPRLSPWP